MKYNININQLALYKSGLDLKDCAILEYIKGWFNADDKKVKQLVISENGYDYRYIWINFNTLIKDMPLLGIKQKASISKRLAKIEKKGFIKRYLAPDGNLYIRLLPKIKTTEFEGVNLDEQEVSDGKHHPLAERNYNILLIKDNINMSAKQPLSDKPTNSSFLSGKETKDEELLDGITEKTTSSQEKSKEIPPEKIAGVQNDTGLEEQNEPITPPSEGKKEEINTRDFFLGEIKPLFLEMLDKYRRVEYYAFDYVKEIAIVKRWIKQVKEKQPDWGDEEIAPRLKSYIKHWFETHDNDPPSISRIFSSNSLNEYRFWVAKTHPGQINTSL